MFEKINARPILRNCILVFCFVGILGAALNDGLTSWFWGVPLLIPIYLLLPIQKKFAALLCVLLIVLMFAVSNTKWTSNFVYPVIGQTIVLKEEIPLKEYHMNYGESSQIPYFDIYAGEEDILSTSEYVVKSSVPEGVVFTVVKIIPRESDLVSSQSFLLENNTSQFIVNDSDISNPYNQEKLVDFCDRVEWQFCDIAMNNSDPMRPILRSFTTLMWYPIFPVMFMSMFESIKFQLES